MSDDRLWGLRDLIHAPEDGLLAQLRRNEGKAAPITREDLLAAIRKLDERPQLRVEANPYIPEGTAYLVSPAALPRPIGVELDHDGKVSVLFVTPSIEDAARQVVRIEGLGE